MNTNQNTILRLAVAAALAGGAATSYAVVDLGIPIPVKFANELPTTGVSLFNAAGDLTFSAPVTSFKPTAGQNLQINVTLSNGAVYVGTPTVLCNITTAGPPAAAGSATLASLNLGGAGTSQAIYSLSQTSVSAQAGDSGTVTTACTVNASAITVASGAHVNINASVTYTYGTLASSTVAGAIITFVKGVSGFITGPSTHVAQVTAGFLTFTAAATTATFGTFSFQGNGSARGAGVDNTAAAAAAIVVADALSSASITAAGASLAGSRTGGVFLVTGGACAAGTQASGGPAASVSFAGLTPAQVSAGLTVCLNVNGTSTIPADSVTATLVGVPNTGFSLVTTLSPNVLATITRNGSSRRALNIPNAVNADQAFIRITNTSALAGRVIGTLIDQTGVVLGTANSVLITAAAFTPNVTVILDAPTLKTLFGIVTDWAGRAQLVINAETTSISVVNAIRAANGTLTNLSSESN